MLCYITFGATALHVHSYELRSAIISAPSLPRAVPHLLCKIICAKLHDDSNMYIHNHVCLKTDKCQLSPFPTNPFKATIYVKMSLHCKEYETWHPLPK